LLREAAPAAVKESARAHVANKGVVGSLEELKFRGRRKKLQNQLLQVSVAIGRITIHAERVGL
jgi:hypothetical protein